MCLRGKRFSLIMLSQHCCSHYQYGRMHFYILFIFVLFFFLFLQFLCLKNIRTFLKVCHDKFGLRNSELFDPFDLFDVRDFGKVSFNISAFRCPKRFTVDGATMKCTLNGA